MKAIVTPVFFYPGKDQEFEIQLNHLKLIFKDFVDFTEPEPLGTMFPKPDSPENERIDAVIFPQLLGEAYRCVEEFRKIHLPILIITSDAGTLSMWDWEICSYLKSAGIETIAPYNQAHSRIIFKALAAKRKLLGGKFLVFQDNPGVGHQASIFKRFYWWEEECSQRMKDKFSLEVVKKSFKQLAESAKLIPDTEAEILLNSRLIPTNGLRQQQLLSAVKITKALIREIDSTGNVLAAGINCLNESSFSDTTPCLAWNMLFEDRKLIWGCEADLLAMLTMYILYSTMEAPLMMTNLYPFLMGEAATKHEKIQAFPIIDQPENHILVAHCGYMGVIPMSFSTEWSLRPKVLEIVDENAHAIDARLAEGKITLVKLDPSFRTLSMISGELEGYVQFAGSHCLNGGIIRVDNGKLLMKHLLSHHYIIMTGDHVEEIELLAQIFFLDVEKY